MKELETDASIRGQIAKNVEKVPRTWLSSLGESNINAYALDEKSPLVIQVLPTARM